VSVPGSPTGETTLEVSENWGGVSAGGQDITDVTATDASGAPLAMSRPAPYQVVVQHAPGATFALNYAFPVNNNQDQTDPGESRRPLMNAHLFRAVGHLGLMVPTFISDEVPCTIHLGWDGFDAAGWRTVSSWGAGTSDRTITTTLFEFTDGLFLAGDFRLITRDIQGYPLTITVAGDDWDFTPEAFADACEYIVEHERLFFDDIAHEFYWISLVPVGPVDQPGRNIGGSGLTHCFSLSIAPNTAFTPEDGSASPIITLLAHEMFHEWNGKLIRREDPEQLVYWFSEGFTDFYARRLCYRGGLIDETQYAQSVTTTVQRYSTNPFRDAPNTRIREDFWNDRDVQKLPYYRGDIVAMLLDGAIRRESGGAKSLDDVMRRVADNARAGGIITTDNLFETFSQFADAATIDTLRNMVEHGGLPALDGLLAPCLVLEPTAVDMFDPGFDLEPSMQEKTVVGVRPGSPAAQAGLEDGMTLKKWSVRRGDTTQPVTLTVVVDGTERDISFYPRGAAVQSYTATVAESARDCPSL
jgi:predicted metalloprotease with PDZ domain